MLILAGLFSHTLTWGVSRGNIAFILAISASIVLAMVIFLSGMSYVGAGKAALLCTFEPVATILFSALLLQERLSPVQILGAVLVIISAIVSVKPQKKGEEEKEIKYAEL